RDPRRAGRPPLSARPGARDDAGRDRARADVVPDAVAHEPERYAAAGALHQLALERRDLAAALRARRGDRRPAAAGGALPRMAGVHVGSASAGRPAAQPGPRRAVRADAGRRRAAWRARAVSPDL